MATLIAGLVIFFGVHTLTTLRELRAGLVARLGPGLYKAAYSLASLIGFVLIVLGYKAYRAAGYIDVWTPPKGMAHLTILLMWPAMVALVAAYVPPGEIKRRLKHPMLVAVKVWALAHLLSNGDLGSIILFGSFLGWAVYDRISVKKRADGSELPITNGGRRNDVVAIVLGTVFWALFMFVLHPLLIGVPVIGR
jgi:uncharacterized membrane protein